MMCECEICKIFKKDGILDSYVAIDGPNPGKGPEINDIIEELKKLELNENVPEDVKKVFQGAKDLCLHGYFNWYFFTIGAHYGFLAVESAMRNKYEEIYGKSKLHLTKKKIWERWHYDCKNKKYVPFVPLMNVFDCLVEKIILKEESRKDYEFVNDWRNDLSHLTQTTVMSFGDAFELLKLTKERIHEIYPGKL